MDPYPLSLLENSNSVRRSSVLQKLATPPFSCSRQTRSYRKNSVDLTTQMSPLRGGECSPCNRRLILCYFADSMRGRNIGLVILLLAATFTVYWPALGGGILWDDDAHITRPALQSIGGLGRIW